MYDLQIGCLCNGNIKQHLLYLMDQLFVSAMSNRLVIISLSYHDRIFKNETSVEAIDHRPRKKFPAAKDVLMQKEEKFKFKHRDEHVVRKTETTIIEIEKCTNCCSW